MELISSYNWGAHRPFFSRRGPKVIKWFTNMSSIHSCLDLSTHHNDFATNDFQIRAAMISYKYRWVKRETIGDMMNLCINTRVKIPNLPVTSEAGNQGDFT